MIPGKKIKILYLITGLNVGGAEVMLWGLVKNLDKEKFEPVVVSIIPIGEIGKKIQKEGIKILSLNAKFKYNLFIFLKLISILKKEKPQILHLHLFHADFLGRITGKISRVPIIISTIHNVNFGGKLREKLLEYTDKFCDLGIVVSQMVAEVMIEKGVISGRKLKVVYNGIELKNFDLDKDISREKIRKKLGIRKNQNALISVGRLFKAKGYPYLVDAINILKKKYPDIRLLILGEGPERKKIEEQVKELRLEKNILLLGQKENVLEYLASTDVFVMPSLWEGFPMALLEVMAFGLPVVAARVGGVPEVIEDNENGFLVEPKSPDALAEKIDYVLSLSTKKKTEICKRAKKTIEEKFSLKKMVKEYENLYQKLLEKNK